MLTIYRRHKLNCEHRKEGRKYRRCRCPIWVDGFLAGQEIRKSLNTADWQKSQDHVREWEASGQVASQPEREPVTIECARDEFLRELKARNLRETSIDKYRVLFRQMVTFAQQSGRRYIKEFDLQALRQFRASWSNRNLSALKKLERLRGFFRFALDSKWVSENYASKIVNPKVTDRPTLPFSREEMIQILASCDRYGENRGQTGSSDERRVRALVLLLRYTGMRIGDAVTLKRMRIKGNKLFLYTAKTGTPVYCPLPNTVIEALEASPRTNEDYFFWTGESKTKSTVGNWQRALKRLFRLAGVPGGHAHRFRDTFAVELLLAGVPIERVSILLGHSSLRVTERHYAPWVRSRQEQLEADVRRTWETDPSVSVETKGTLEVHEIKPLVH